MCTPVSCPSQTRCSMPAPWGKFFRAKKRWAAAVVNSDKQEHVFKSISIICNQSCWNNSIFSGHWAQLLNTLAVDRGSEVIKPKMVQAGWSQQGEPTTRFGSFAVTSWEAALALYLPFRKVRVIGTSCWWISPSIPSEVLADSTTLAPYRVEPSRNPIRKNLFEKISPSYTWSVFDSK